MKRLRAIALSGFCLGTVAFLGLRVSEARACSCSGASVEQHYEYADAVFEGIIAERRLQEDESIVYVFEVEDVWKGTEAGATLEVWGGTGSCEIPAAPGERWIVLATLRPGNRYVGMGTCSKQALSDSEDGAPLRERLDEVASGCAVIPRRSHPPWTLLVPVLAWTLRRRRRLPT